MELKMNINEPGQWHQSLTFKMILIGVMVLVLLIPLGMVKSVITEREETEQQVDQEMMQQWGGPQMLSGPILHVPITYYIKADDEKIKTSHRWLHIMPEDLNITGHVSPEIRYRGIYKKVLYNSELSITGSFGDLTLVTSNAHTVDWNNAYLTLAVSDNRGIKGNVVINWMGTDQKPEAGLITTDLASSGMSIKVPLNAGLLSTAKAFDISLNISGSNGLTINPIGKKTDIQIQSSWQDPNFIGSFLPTERSISEAGFTAHWTVTNLNRNFPQYWEGRSYSIDEHQLGVDLFVPVNHYQKSIRSAKYGILIITLTLLVFLFTELVKKKRIQLFQYFLVGLALVLFFSILTALSEHLGFSWAYLIASLGIVTMVTLYSYGILKDRIQAIWIFISLSILYAFLFVLLQLNDFAFLAGNIGLFIALGAIMKASSKIKTSHLFNTHLES